MRYLFPLSPYNQQRQFEKLVWVYPVHLAMYATYLRNQGHEVFWDDNTWAYDSSWEVIARSNHIKVPFLELPYPDRIFTDAKNPLWQKYGNYKYHPATHMMAAHGCWWGKCSFCVEQKNKFVVRDINHVIEEIENLIHLGFKEVFDDSATFPSGSWLQTFCSKMKNRRITLGCNMRMIDEDYSLMKASGFRMVLFGIESANQGTLDKINKGTKTSDIQWVIKAAKAGLEPHVSAIVGFPWETEKEALNTINLVKKLLINGYAKTAQMSFYTPPEHKFPKGNESQRKFVDNHYSVAFSPLFWYNKIKDIKSFNDFNYFIRGIKEGISYYAKTNNKY